MLISCPHQTDIDTSIYGKIEEKLGKELVQAALQYKLEDVISKTLAAEYKTFRQAAQYYNAGLNFFTEQKYLLPSPSSQTSLLLTT